MAVNVDESPLDVEDPVVVFVQVVAHFAQKLLVRFRVARLDVVDLVLKVLDLDLYDFGEDDRLAVDALPLAVVVEGVLWQEGPHLALFAVDPAHVGAELRGVSTPTKKKKM